MGMSLPSAKNFRQGRAIQHAAFALVLRQLDYHALLQGLDSSILGECNSPLLSAAYYPSSKKKYG